MGVHLRNIVILSIFFCALAGTALARPAYDNTPEQQAGAPRYACGPGYRDLKNDYCAPIRHSGQRLQPLPAFYNAYRPGYGFFHVDLKRDGRMIRPRN